MSDKRAIELAGQALSAALDGDWKAASLAVQAVADECGGDGLTTAIVAWCDTVIVRHPAMAGLQAGKIPRLAWTEDQAGGIESAGDVGAPVRWAGQLIMARALMDQPAFGALIGAIPEGGNEEYVSAVLEMAAATLPAIADGRVAERMAEAAGGGTR